jgi:uncharacterized membrane protein
LLTPLADLVRLVTKDPFWSHAAFYAASSGAVTALVALVPSLIDWIALPGDQRPSSASLAVTSVGVTFALVSAVARLASGAAGFATATFALTLAACALVLAGGWLGNERPNSADRDDSRFVHRASSPRIA